MAALSVEAARAEAAGTAERLRDMALDLPVRPGVHQERVWIEDARTFAYHTLAAGPAPDRTSGLAGMFLTATTLDAHPWYPQFRGGTGSPLSEHEVLGVGRFDVGLGADRAYRQVATRVGFADSQVVVLRSVDAGEVPTGAVEAFTLAPTGDVFRHVDGLLCWHHIVTTAGAELFPRWCERAIMNTLRRLGLDSAERATYLGEAHAFLEWIRVSPPPA